MLLGIEVFEEVAVEMTDGKFLGERYRLRIGVVWLEIWLVRGQLELERGRRITFSDGR